MSVLEFLVCFYRMAARNISDAVSVSISLIQPDPFRGQSSSAPNFMGFGRSDSTNSDEGVVMADGHTGNYFFLFLLEFFLCSKFSLTYQIKNSEVFSVKMMVIWNCLI
jgi:hypothetical protein